MRDAFRHQQLLFPLGMMISEYDKVGHAPAFYERHRLHKAGQAIRRCILLVRNRKTLSQRLIFGAGNLFGSACQNVYCLLINIIYNT
jgi:hypothetical protein